MKKGDIVWGVLLAFLLALFLVPFTRDPILSASEAYPYIGGFIKFAILATMGDILGKRIASGLYQLSTQVLLRSIVWGIIGCMVTLVFPVFMGSRSSTVRRSPTVCRSFLCSSALRQQYYEPDVCSSHEYFPSSDGHVD